MQIFPHLLSVCCFSLNKTFDSLFPVIFLQDSFLLLVLDPIQKETRKFRLINVFKILCPFLSFLILDALFLQILLLMMLHVFKTEISLLFEILELSFDLFGPHLLLLDKVIFQLLKKFLFLFLKSLSFFVEVGSLSVVYLPCHEPLLLLCIVTGKQIGRAHD